MAENNFYGGRPGTSFVLKKTFNSFEAMKVAFAQGVAYSEVWYGEYCIIASGLSDSHNGEIYQRTLEDVDGYKKIGQFVGLAGTGASISPRKKSDIEDILTEHFPTGLWVRYPSESDPNGEATATTALTSLEDLKILNTSGGQDTTWEAVPAVQFFEANLLHFADGVIYYELVEGNYEPTQDTTPDPEKTYYILEDDVYVEATLSRIFDSGITYYEITTEGYQETTDEAPQADKIYYIRVVNTDIQWTWCVTPSDTQENGTSTTQEKFYLWFKIPYSIIDFSGAEYNSGMVGTEYQPSVSMEKLEDDINSPLYQKYKLSISGGPKGDSFVGFTVDGRNRIEKFKVKQLQYDETSKTWDENVVEIAPEENIYINASFQVTVALGKDYVEEGDSPSVQKALLYLTQNYSGANYHGSVATAITYEDDDSQITTFFGYIKKESGQNEWEWKAIGDLASANSIDIYLLEQNGDTPEIPVGINMTNDTGIVLINKELPQETPPEITAWWE